MHVIEQEMDTLRQGNLSLLQYYDEVERKLTLLTNKATRSYEASAAQVLCEKFRDDALRVFISGLKRSLTDVLFSARPKDMPSALALAQGVESNHERYTFASSFARSQKDRPILMLIRNQVLVKIRTSINSTKLKHSLLHAVIGFKEILPNPWMLTRHCPGCLNHLRPRHTKIGSRPRPIDRDHIMLLLVLTC